MRTLGDTLKIKVDDATKLHGNLLGRGRRSVRLESVTRHAEGLIVGNFRTCPNRSVEIGQLCVLSKESLRVRVKGPPVDL